MLIHNCLCSWCSQDQEDWFHLFWECIEVAAVWKDIFKWWNIDPTFNIQREEFLVMLFKLCKDSHYYNTWKITVAITLWNIWKARNESIFQLKKFIGLSLVVQIKRESLECFHHFRMVFKEASNFWFCEPRTYIQHIEKEGIKIFLSRLMEFYDYVALSDGAWIVSQNFTGEMGGYILDNNKSLIFAASGPCKASSAIES